MFLLFSQIEERLIMSTGSTKSRDTGTYRFTDSKGRTRKRSCRHRNTKAVVHRLRLESRTLNLDGENAHPLLGQEFKSLVAGFLKQQPPGWHKHPGTYGKMMTSAGYMACIQGCEEYLIEFLSNARAQAEQANRSTIMLRDL